MPVGCGVAVGCGVFVAADLVGVGVGVAGAAVRVLVGVGVAVFAGVRVGVAVGWFGKVEFLIFTVMLVLPRVFEVSNAKAVIVSGPSGKVVVSTLYGEDMSRILDPAAGVKSTSEIEAPATVLTATVSVPETS